MVDPVFGLPAKWVPEAHRVQTESLGATVAVREVLAPGITEQHAREGQLAVLGFDPLLERELITALGVEAASARLDAGHLQAMIDQIRDLIMRAEGDGHQPVLICLPALCRALMRMLESLDNAPLVFSLREIGPPVQITTVGTVTYPSTVIDATGGNTQLRTPCFSKVRFSRRC